MMPAISAKNTQYISWTPDFRQADPLKVSVTSQSAPTLAILWPKLGPFHDLYTVLMSVIDPWLPSSHAPT